MEKLVQEFNARQAQGSLKRTVKIHGEIGLELESTLMSRIDPSVRPDLMLIPSDMMGFRNELQLVELPASWTSLGAPVRKEGLVAPETHGVPVLQGNQLYLFYNKRLVKKVPATWQELKQQHGSFQKRGLKTIGWPYCEPYYFLPFLQAFGTFDPEKLNTPSMEATTAFYRELALSGLVPHDCGIDCSTSRFFKGEFAYVISGDWAIAEAKAKLKEHFGLAHLPAISDAQPMISGEVIQYLVFPKKEAFVKHEALLRDFSAFLVSEPVQARFFKEADRLPVIAGYQPPVSASSKPVPSGKSVFYSWIALRKGLQLLKAGERGIGMKMQKDLELLIRSESPAR